MKVNMKKKIKQNFLNIVILACFCLTALFCFAEEQITITTYYPSPVGVYRELRSVYMSVGVNYSNNSQFCWAGGCPATGVVDWLTSLIVQGRVGIGTHNSTSPLDIVWMNLPETTPPTSFGWAVGQNFTYASTTADPANFSQQFIQAGGLMGFTAGDGTDALPRGWYVVDTASGAAQNEFYVNFDNDTIFLNRAIVGTAAAANPTLNVTGLSLFNGNALVGGGTAPDYTTINSALDVRGYSNTCIVMSYGTNSGDTACPDTYYITTPSSVTPPLTGVMKFVCCKVCENEGLNSTGACPYYDI